MTIENEIAFICYYKPIADDLHERRHVEIYEKFKDFPYPFNFPIEKAAPSFGRNISTSYIAKHKEIKTLYFISRYCWRSERHMSRLQNLSDYDQLEIKFGHKKQEIDYHKALYELFPKVVEFYGGCRAKLMVRDVWIYYQRSFKELKEKILAEERVDFDGKDHIFNLHPAQYWSNDLCKKALGYDAKEVIQRLEKAGALLAIPVLDGVYCVLNENRDIELEEFTEMNTKFKKALGINDGTSSKLSTVSKFLNSLKS